MLHSPVAAVQYSQESPLAGALHCDLPDVWQRKERQSLAWSLSNTPN